MAHKKPLPEPWELPTCKCGARLRPVRTTAEQYPGTSPRRDRETCDRCGRAKTATQLQERKAERAADSVARGQAWVARYAADRARRGIPPWGTDPNNIDSFDDGPEHVDRCPKGHPFTPENTGRYKENRYCKTCRIQRRRERQRKLIREVG